jgi:hypothetical protein
VPPQGKPKPRIQGTFLTRWAGFKPFGYLQCLARGHHSYTSSRTLPAYLTCKRCRHRKLKAA